MKTRKTQNIVRDLQFEEFAETLLQFKEFTRPVLLLKAFAAKSQRQVLLGFAAIFALGALTACDHSTPDHEFMPDMYESTSFKAQKEDPNSKDGAAARVPPEGTIPRGFEPYHYAALDGDKAGAELKNPLARTKAVVERGQKQYNTYCIVCHGPKADGAGFIVPPFVRPPTLHSDKVRNWSDGRIFHVITRGQNIMPSYAQQILPEDRWAIIYYLRALQRSENPTPEDLKELGSATK